MRVESMDLLPCLITDAFKYKYRVVGELAGMVMG